jgi:hypothetical protein
VIGDRESPVERATRCGQQSRMRHERVVYGATTIADLVADRAPSLGQSRLGRARLHRLWNDGLVTTVEDAFRSARIHAVRHMAACERADLRWAETSITESVISRAADAVTVVPFTQAAEKLGGADWIWWWVDHRGAYGMLVQAKRVTVTRDKWHFGFDYPNGTGGQRVALMATSRALGLLPVYVLYLGTGDYRGWERCSDGHRSGRCLQCVKRSVSLMPALLASEQLVNCPEDRLRAVSSARGLVDAG